MVTSDIVLGVFLFVFMSLFHPMDHYNDIGHVNTNVILQLNV